MSQPSLLRAISILTYLSLSVSIVVFILSMLDLGLGSFFTNPIVSALTIVYHTVVLILHVRQSKSAPNLAPSQPRIYPTSTIVSLVFAYVLASAWLVAVSMTAIAPDFADDPNSPIAENPGRELAQLILCVIEFGILSTVAGLSTRMRVVFDRLARQKPASPPSPRSMSSLLRAFYVLTYTSLGSLTLLFTLSMLDLGVASLWTNPPLAGLTIIYHSVILVLQRCQSRSQAETLDNVPPEFRPHPTAKIASLVFAYLLACAWAIPIAFVPIGGGIYPYSYPSYWSNSLYAGNYRTVIVQLVLDVIELPLLFAIAGVSTRIRVLLDQWERSQKSIVFLPEIRPTTSRGDDGDDASSLNSTFKAPPFKAMFP